MLRTCLPNKTQYYYTQISYPNFAYTKPKRKFFRQNGITQISCNGMVPDIFKCVHSLRFTTVVRIAYRLRGLSQHSHTVLLFSLNSNSTETYRRFTKTPVPEKNTSPGDVFGFFSELKAPSTDLGPKNLKIWRPTFNI